MSTAPVILIGLDAAEIGIVERLIGQGRMPNLAALRRGGLSGLLQPRLDLFEAMSWHRLMEGRNVSPRYYQKVWRAERMGFAMDRGPEFEPRQPFWVDVARAGGAVATVDVPLLRRNPDPGVRLFVKGWQAANDQARHAEPAELLRELEDRVGPPVMPPEPYARARRSVLLAYRERALRAAEQAAEMGRWLLARRHWDLFFFVFGSTHNVGHYFWDTGQIRDRRSLSARERLLLEATIDDVYAGVDRSLGRILDALPSGARVLVFSPYGMAINRGWIERFGGMIDRIHDGVDVPDRSTTALGRLRRRVLGQPFVSLFRSLPQPAQDRLVAALSPHTRDWSSTRLLRAAGESEGFVRVNLRGREAGGIVEPGAEYGRVLDEVADGLTSFRDLDTGLPVVRRVHRIDEQVPPRHPDRHWLPDLVVSWTDQLSAADSRGVSSPVHGEIGWAKGAPFVSGRSGEHRVRGWFVASGPGITPGFAAEPRDTIDLAPTVTGWLLGYVPDRFEGIAMTGGARSHGSTRAALHP